MEVIRILVALLLCCFGTPSYARTLLASTTGTLGSRVSIINNFASGGVIVVDCKTSNFDLEPHPLASKAVYPFRVKAGFPETSPITCAVTTTAGFLKSFVAWPKNCEECRWSVTENTACLFDDRTSKFDVCVSYK